MPDFVKIALDGFNNGLKLIPPWLWVVLWVLYYIFSRLVGKLIAPTDQFPSTTTLAYRQRFRWVNELAGNHERAKLWRRGLKETNGDE